MSNTIRAYRVGEKRAGGALTFIASTAGIKRDGKNLDSSLWYLDNYRKNPVVLFSHAYSGPSLPIGKANVSIERDQLLADVTFDQADSFAREVERKYREGFLNAVSVGWAEVKVNSKLRYDLLDISAVNVPADPDAVMVKMRKYNSYLERELREEATRRVLAEFKDAQEQIKDLKIRIGLLFALVRLEELEKKTRIK